MIIYSHHLRRSLHNLLRGSVHAASERSPCLLRGRYLVVVVVVVVVVEVELEVVVVVVVVVVVEY
jgi:hypothetical protein